jgi:hypothetical protein
MDDLEAHRDRQIVYSATYRLGARSQRMSRQPFGHVQLALDMSTGRVQSMDRVQCLDSGQTVRVGVTTWPRDATGCRAV